MEPSEPEWWRPELQTKWFHITADGLVQGAVWEDSPSDQAMWQHGNCFATYEEAEHAREVMRKVLRHLH